MTNNTRKFDDLVSLYRKVKFDSNRTRGTLEITSEEILVCIQDILNAPDDFGISLESGDVAIGTEVMLHIIPPKLKLGQLHNDFDDYLKNGRNRLREAKSYFIINDNYYNNDKKTPRKITNYRLLLRTIGLFKECAAYLDESNCELVFVDSSVIKIPVNYTCDILNMFSPEKAKEFLALFSQDTHREQKLTILANTLKSMSETKNRDSSFLYLFNDFDQLTESFIKGYNVYVSGFSYEKIIDQLRVAKIEDMGKIHKVFSDIQNQILGIPLATILVATQMKQTNQWDAQAYINTIILVGAIFFTAMMLFAVFNQWQTLNAISEELVYKKNQAKTKYNAIYGDIKGTFDSLRKRVIAQRLVFLFLGIFVILGISLAFKFYLSLTSYAYNFIFN